TLLNMPPPKYFREFLNIVNCLKIKNDNSDSSKADNFDKIKNNFVEHNFVAWNFQNNFQCAKCKNDLIGLQQQGVYCEGDLSNL
ncbi:hypothetical protein MXB_5605, partial [Myxobolus squamalis]